jgi:putative phosphoribosyl transferase
VTLDGDLSIPSDAVGLVAFAHGSGSSRFSPRNRFVAGVLEQAGLATMLMDLLTLGEEHIDQLTKDLRFNIELLTARLVAAIDWLAEQPDTRQLPLGCFGASTGAAAALVAAAERPQLVRGVVSRGGRPDLAEEALGRIRARTLLIVGGRDQVVVQLNRTAFERLRCEKRLEVVPGATHLFEEPGTLEVVAKLARDWFLAGIVLNPHVGLNHEPSNH